MPRNDFEDKRVEKKRDAQTKDRKREMRNKSVTKERVITTVKLLTTACYYYGKHKNHSGL